MEDLHGQQVKLATRDGVIIEASRAAACRCVTICNMLEDAGGDDAVPELPLALVDARALRHVLNYCQLRQTMTHSHMRDLGTLLRLPLEELFELVAATNFLEMPQFFELSCGAVAEHIRRSSSAEAIRGRFGIAPDMSAAELKTTSNEDPFTADSSPVVLSCSVSAAMGCDVFEACLLQLDGAQLRKVKSVCLAWRSASRRVCCSVEWPAQHLSLRKLIKALGSRSHDRVRKPAARKHEVRKQEAAALALLEAALRARLAQHPQEAAVADKVRAPPPSPPSPPSPRHPPPVPPSPPKPTTTAAAVQAGDLPLHLAAEQHLSREAVGCILTAHPDALRHVNNSGCLPLDLAIEARPQADSTVLLGPQLTILPWPPGGWALQGSGCATHSGRAAAPLRVLWGPYGGVLWGRTLWGAAVRAL
jgi:hypothetical protein